MTKKFDAVWFCSVCISSTSEGEFQINSVSDREAHNSALENCLYFMGEYHKGVQVTVFIDKSVDNNPEASEVVAHLCELSLLDMKRQIDGEVYKKVQDD